MLLTKIPWYLREIKVQYFLFLLPLEHPKPTHKYRSIKAYASWVMNERLIDGIDQMTRPRPRHQNKLNVNKELSIQSHSVQINTESIHI